MPEGIMQPSEGFRLSPQQRRMWVERRRHHGNWQRTVVAWVIEGDLDPAALRSAVESVVARHEILRTRFVTLPGGWEPLQVIGEPNVDWAGVRESDDAAPDGEERSENAWEAAVDPVTGPLLGVSLARLDRGRHRLAMTLPSLLGDALGALRLAQEVCRIYGARREGPGPPEEILQYADLAEWQNELLEGEEAQAGRSYWEETRWSALAGALPELREAAGPFAPQALPLPLDAETVSGLEAAAEACGGPLRALLLACWQVLLAGWSGREDFAIGVSYDGRRYGELARALGPLARCLPFPCHLEQQLPFGDLVTRVAERDAEHAQWQESFPVETAAGAAFSAVRFDVLPADPEDLATEGALACRLSTLRSYGERFALALEGWSAAGTVTLAVHYDAALFSAGEIELLTGRFASLLASAGVDLRRPIAGLDVVPTDERRRLLEVFNPAPAPLPPARCIQEQIEEWASRAPERPAVAAGDRTLTYGELNARANRLARHLQARGAEPEMRVALCLERSVDMVVALLATLKAGAAYVPIDPVLPRERMALMLEDSRARLVVATEGLAPTLPATGIPVVWLDREAEAIGEQPEADLPPGEPGGLAYVIFTSGSTGRPKGVGVEHRQLFQYVQGLLARLGPPGAGFATVSTFAADLGYTAVFPALATGGCLHVIPVEQATDAQWLAGYFRAHPIDVLKITPSHLAALLASSPGRDLLPRRWLILGGEVLSWELAERIAGLAPDCAVLNHYGPTEATVGVCTCRVGGRAEVPAAASVPIGRPLPHARIHLLDETRLVPLGTPGEVFLGGAGLARGYPEDPRLTAERFVPDPFASEPGGRLYRTGDRARWHLSGDLEFLGRTDDQLKVRGFRVEPGEVARALEAHPAVAAAGVIGREESPGNLQLAAYVVVDAASAGPVHRLVRLRSNGRLNDQSTFDLPNGMTVVHLNEGETRFLYREIFEEQTYLRHGIRIPDEACVVDVGASIGLFSLLAARGARGVQVFAFEPVPSVARALRLNAEIYGGIRAFDFGLSRETCEAAITFYPHLTLMSSLYGDVREEREVVRSFLRGEATAGTPPPAESLIDELLEDRLASEMVTVRLRRLSDVLREHTIERIDLLKIDAQKSEHDVLAGIDDDDWPRIDQVVLEVHDIADRLRHVVELLESKGYEVAFEQERMLAGTPLYDVYARRPGVSVPAPSGEPGAPLWSSPAGLLEELRRHLRASLPDYMLPATLSLLPELPLTPNGKLDRRALPDPRALAFDAQRHCEPPRTTIEAKLVEIWRTVLGPRRFGIRDSFFEIGGHSLLATRVIARIRKEFEVEFNLRDFFNDATIAGIARRIEIAEPLAASQEERIGRLMRAAYRQSAPRLD